MGRRGIGRRRMRRDEGEEEEEGKKKKVEEGKKKKEGKKRKERRRRRRRRRRRSPNDLLLFVSFRCASVEYQVPILINVQPSAAEQTMFYVEEYLTRVLEGQSPQKSLDEILKETGKSSITAQFIKGEFPLELII